MNLSDRCPVCQIHAKKKPKMPESQISTPRMFEVLGIDLMDFHGQLILVLIEYYSGYNLVD